VRYLYKGRLPAFPASPLHILFPVNLRNINEAFLVPNMCPRGVDQTMRGSQYWLMVAPEIKQRFSPNYSDDKAANLIYRGQKDLRNTYLDPRNAWEICSKLARPDISSQFKASSRLRRPLETSILDRLSVELLKFTGNKMWRGDAGNAGSLPLYRYLTAVPLDHVLFFGLLRGKFDWWFDSFSSDQSYPSVGCINDSQYLLLSIKRLLTKPLR